ncbi:MAG: hypothetical protein HY094_09360 [Candidatus Melainabacteria bacterium]|nr:hypothetical protein [Candidatus Melainabacteria bacterium]
MYMRHCEEHQRRSNPANYFKVTFSRLLRRFFEPPRNDVVRSVLLFFASIAISISHAQAKLGNKVHENEKQFGKELITKQFSETEKNFTGKKIYQFPLHGWQVEAIYRDGRSFSETARPKGNKVKNQMLTEREANVIADMLYPRKDRGSYKKQIDNANFVSHFFEYGVVSYEMELDKRRKKHVGVVGVRTVLYSDGDKFKNIMVNAYH